jgi:sortase A
VNESAGPAPVDSSQPPAPERSQGDAPARALFSVISSRPASRPRRGLERALWAVSAAAGLYLGFVTVDRTLFAQQAARRLEAATLEMQAAPASELAAPVRERGPFLARLEIRSIGLEALVVDGVDETTLRRAVGRMPKSARPGEPGNVVLAGHRDTDFRGLEKVKRGDRIAIHTAEGAFDYEVESIRVVDPSRIEHLAPTDQPSLTLVTCFPFRYIGAAPQRYLVRARELARPAPQSVSGASARLAQAG